MTHTVHPSNHADPPFRAPLIGEHVQIVASHNTTLVGLSGTVTDETKNTFTLQTRKTTKTIIKPTVTIDLKGVTITPASLRGRGDERIKK